MLITFSQNLEEHFLNDNKAGIYQQLQITVNFILHNFLCRDHFLLVAPTESKF